MPPHLSARTARAPLELRSDPLRHLGRSGAQKNAGPVACPCCTPTRGQSILRLSPECIWKNMGADISRRNVWPRTVEAPARKWLPPQAQRECPRVRGTRARGGGGGVASARAARTQSPGKTAGPSMAVTGRAGNACDTHYHTCSSKLEIQVYLPMTRATIEGVRHLFSGIFPQFWSLSNSRSSQKLIPRDQKKKNSIHIYIYVPFG